MKKLNAALLISLIITFTGCKSYHIIQVDHKITIALEKDTQEFISNMVKEKAKINEKKNIQDKQRRSN